MCLISFGDDSTEPSALPCRDDAMVDKDAEAPKLCLSPVEIRTPTAAGGLFPAGTASTAMRTIFFRPLPSWALGEETNERTNRANFNQLAPACWKRVIQTKSRQILVLNPGGCKDHLRACPFLGGWHALLCGEVFFWTLENIRG